MFFFSVSVFNSFVLSHTRTLKFVRLQKNREVKADPGGGGMRVHQGSRAPAPKKGNIRETHVIFTTGFWVIESFKIQIHRWIKAEGECNKTEEDPRRSNWGFLTGAETVFFLLLRRAFMCCHFRQIPTSSNFVFIWILLSRSPLVKNGGNLSPMASRLSEDAGFVLKGNIVFATFLASGRFDHLPHESVDQRHYCWGLFLNSSSWFSCLGSVWPPFESWIAV